MVKRIGLFGGPMMGLLCYSLLPLRYSTGPGEWLDFTQVGRAALGLMSGWLDGGSLKDIEATGLVRLPQMMKTGFWLNLAGIVVTMALVTLFVVTLLGPVFGPES